MTIERKPEKERNRIIFRGSGRSVQEGLRVWVSENDGYRVEQSSASLTGSDHVVMTVEYSEKKKD